MRAGGGDRAEKGTSVIEKCDFCGEIHDVGDGDTQGGLVFKTCPEVNPHHVWFWNPKDFRQDVTLLDLTTPQNLNETLMTTELN